MMDGGSWQSLRDELARWKDAGRVADFWWRDDDAGSPNPLVRRLLDLSCSMAVPLGLAVIPQDAQADLLDEQDVHVSVLQHGVAHRNLSQPGEKKSEFPATEMPAAAIHRLRQGQAQLAALFGPRVLPVLVPPWNRISSPALLPLLPTAGLSGLSRYGPRKRMGALPGLVEVNTHVDVIDWKGTRGFVGESVALGQAVAHLRARRLGEVDAGEPTGWLTHHAVHDAATWGFLQRLFECTVDGGMVVWRSPAELLAKG